MRVGKNNKVVGHDHAPKVKSKNNHLDHKVKELVKNNKLFDLSAKNAIDTEKYNGFKKIVTGDKYKKSRTSLEIMGLYDKYQRGRLGKEDFLSAINNQKIPQHLKNVIENFVKIDAPIKKPFYENTDNLNTDFLCSNEQYYKTLASLKGDLAQVKDFDARVFLNPKYQDPKVVKKNDEILNNASTTLEKLAKKISDEQGVSLTDGFKKIIGVLDHYDANSHFGDRPSSFMLRSALLLASQKNGASIESWMAYTKGGKPAMQNPAWTPWSFLDNWNNWVPEAQGMMAKFAEIQSTKARALAAEHNENVDPFNNTGKVVLLKGGFGAGKSHLAGKHLKSEREEEENRGPEGPVAPDIAKRVVRQAMPQVSHGAAHVQGSQIAYKLFDDFIQNIVGTVAYDSSLSDPRDIQAYLEKCKKAGKKMEIHDVARNDVARFLSVLKRSVGGDDPRIPVERMIAASIQDKENRVDCMNVVLNDTTTGALAPVYHFHGSKEKGFANEVLTFGSNGEVDFNLDPQEAIDRLRLEGITLNDAGQPMLITDKKAYVEDLQKYFADQCEKKVSSLIRAEVSDSEGQALSDVFGKRNLPLKKGASITNASELYEALPRNIRGAIAKSAFEGAFASLKEETRHDFFTSIKNKAEISYLDLPLRAALTIHQHLQKDPWL